MRTAISIFTSGVLFLLVLGGCSGPRREPASSRGLPSQEVSDSKTTPVPLPAEDTSATPSANQEVPSALVRLRAAYPDAELVLEDNTLVIDGEYRVPWEDVRGQLAADYPAFAPLDVPEADPGRVRSEAFFGALYGSNSDAVRRHLEAVTWLPGIDNTTLWISSKHGAAEALRRVSQELVRLPSLHPYLVDPAGGFVYRTIAGTNRLSAHSWGIAVDIGLRYADYWRWAGSPNGSDGVEGEPPAFPSEPPAPPYKNQIPARIVEAFERNGYVWGGRWEHFDTMHFEYRPELVDQNDAPNRRFIGESVEGRIIEAYEFGAGPIHLVLVGGIHGAYEWNSVELMGALLDHWSEDPPVADGLTVHVIPAMNPDARDTRVNSRGVDLNRNWRTPDWTSHPPAGGGVLWAEGGAEPFSEPETRAVADYIRALASGGPDGAVAVYALFYHALLRPGLYDHRGMALPGYTDAGGVDGGARLAAAEYAAATGYRYADRFSGGYTTTGEAIHWGALNGVHAVDIELPDTDDPFAKPLVYEHSHFQSARLGVAALVDLLSESYTAFIGAE